jgi:hypothetical protein
MFRIDRQSTEDMMTVRWYGKVEMVLSLVLVAEPLC